MAAAGSRTVDVEALPTGGFLVISESEDGKRRDAYLYDDIGSSVPSLDFTSDLLVNPKYVQKSLRTKMFYISDEKGIWIFDFSGKYVGRVPTSEKLNTTLKFAVYENHLAFVSPDGEGVWLMQLTDDPADVRVGHLAKFPEPADVGAIAFNNAGEVVVTNRKTDHWLSYDYVKSNF